MSALRQLHRGLRRMSSKPQGCGVDVGDPRCDELADALTELMIGEIAVRGGVSIVGKEEFQAQLGQTEARSLECIGSAACLGRVGVELQVDEVVAGTVGRTESG